MVLYVFNVPRLHKHSQQVDGLHFFVRGLPAWARQGCGCAICASHAYWNINRVVFFFLLVRLAFATTAAFSVSQFGVANFFYSA